MVIKIRMKKQLEEITRYEKETGSKYNIMDEFSSRVSEQPSEYAFTMTSVPKIGINPKTGYNTPAGVYCYPLDSRRFGQLMENGLPFMSDAPYVGLIKLNWNANWLIFRKTEAGSGTREDEQRVAKFLKDVYGFEMSASYDPIHWYHSPNARIFDMTYFCSRERAAANGTRPTIMWTKILRDLGYDGVYDEGSGIIHNAEMTQLVCLTLNAYEKVGIYEVPALRVLSTTTQEKGERKKNKALLAAKQKKKWEDFAKLPPNKKIIRDEDSINITYLYEKYGEKMIDVLSDTKFTGNVTADVVTPWGTITKLPKNMVVFGILAIYLGKSLTPFVAENVEAHELLLCDATVMPKGIEFTNLNLANNYTKINLPEGFDIPGDLKTYGPYLSLPNNIKIGGTLYVHGHIDPYTFFPENFDFQSFRGTLFGEEYIDITKEEVKNIIKAKGLKKYNPNADSASGESPMKEVFNKWKKFL